MSTNKTENYGLHAWEPGDDFLHTEINQNFSKLDKALAALNRGKIGAITGRYSGKTDAPLRVELGAKPLAVHIERPDGYRHGSTTYGGLFDSDNQYRYVQLDSTGFTVTSTYLLDDHIYIAFVEG